MIIIGIVRSIALPVLLFLSLTAMSESLDRTECVEKSRNQYEGDFHSYALSFPAKHIEKALKGVPSQHKYRNIKLWSCGPNSIARAMILVSGEVFFSSEMEYAHFAQSVPKTLGEYMDHRFDERLVIDNHLLRMLNYPVRLLYISNFLQLLITRLSLEVGAMPVWLADYMNEYAASSDRPGFNFEFYSSTTFPPVMDEIKSRLLMGHAVIPLMIMGPLNWHCLNIIGWDENSETILIMDTDSRIYRWSIKVLKCLMNTGANNQWAGLGDILSLGGGCSGKSDF